MKNTFVKVFCVILAAALYILLAVGSGSAPANENPDYSGTSAEGQNTIPPSDEKVEYSVGTSSAFAYINSIGTSYITVVVPVTNTGNTNLFLSASTMDIEDANGSLAASLSLVGVYPQIIQPGETAYYYEDTLYNGTETANLTVVPHVKAEKATVDCIRFALSDLQVSDNNFGGSSIIGRVENTSNEEQSMIYVIANLFNSDGKLLEQGFTILDGSLTPGDKIGFKMSVDSLPTDIATYDVFAFPYQFQW